MYILIKDKQVTLAGMVANQEMIDEGYFEYVGEVPTYNIEYQTLVFNDDVITVTTDTSKLAELIESRIQTMLDTKAKELGYDNMVSACSYAGYPNKFQEEAVKLGTWRSNVWDKAYELQASMTEVPTIEEVLNQLPKFE